MIQQPHTTGDYLGSPKLQKKESVRFLSLSLCTAGYAIPRNNAFTFDDIM